MRLGLAVGPAAHADEEADVGPGRAQRRVAAQGAPEAGGRPEPERAEQAGHQPLGGGRPVGARPGAGGPGVEGPQHLLEPAAPQGERQRQPEAEEPERREGRGQAGSSTTSSGGRSSRSGWRNRPSMNLKAVA